MASEKSERTYKPTHGTPRYRQRMPGSARMKPMTNAHAWPERRTVFILSSALFDATPTGILVAGAMGPDLRALGRG
jgi:hypothetical protein